MTTNKAQEPRKSLVYSVVNTLTGDEYVGITCRGLSPRRSSHIHYAIKRNSQTHFHRAIRKYGVESFVWTIELECEDYNSAKKKEVEIILSRSPHYNMTAGGDGTVGYRFPPELVERLAAQARGRPGPWSGREMPPAFREGGRAWCTSSAGREVWRNNRVKGPAAIARSVICLNDGREYESIAAASKEYSVDASTITEICKKRGKRFSASGLVFRYSTDTHYGAKEAVDVTAQALARQRSNPKLIYIKQVICHNDGMLFDSVKNCAKHYELSPGTVIASCKHRHIYDRKNKPIFSYLDEYRRSID